MPKDYISREDAISCVKHAWAKGLEPTQYMEDLDAADVVSWDFLKRYAEHFLAIVSPEEFVREAKGFWEELKGEQNMEASNG